MPADDPPMTAVRRYAPIAAGLLVAVLLLTAGSMLWMSQQPDDGASALGAPIGGPFSLTAGDGSRVTQASWPGKYLLVYFGYTFCPDVCPTTLTDVVSALDKLGSRAARIQPVFITVDPKRDTPEVVRQYVAAFSPRLAGLTGTPDEIAQVAREYRVYFAVHKTGPGPDDYTMDHSSILYLMAPDGKFVAVIRADTPDATAAEIAKRLPQS